jgi:hypothetical protein
MRYLQRGITVYDRDRAAQGYTLFTPLLQQKAYLIDMTGSIGRAASPRMVNSQ